MRFNIASSLKYNKCGMDYTRARAYMPGDGDESAELKVRRMNVHLKGQGKMQVSNDWRKC